MLRRLASDADGGLQLVAEGGEALHAGDRSLEAVFDRLVQLHRGIGTGACGPDVLPEYRIAPGEYRFSYRLTSG